MQEYQQLPSALAASIDLYLLPTLKFMLLLVHGGSGWTKTGPCDGFLIIYEAGEFSSSVDGNIL